MTTLTDSVPHSLKLALHTTTANEWSEAPDYAYLEISPVQARAMLDLLRVTNAFRTDAARAGLLNRFFAISVGTGEMIPNFQMIWIPLRDGQEPDGIRTAVELPEAFDPEYVGADNEHRVECHRIELGDERVRFTALLKHGSDQFTTANLDRATLEAIAEGRATEIPVGLMSDEWTMQ